MKILWDHIDFYFTIQDFCIKISLIAVSFCYSFLFLLPFSSVFFPISPRRHFAGFPKNLSVISCAGEAGRHGNLLQAQLFRIMMVYKGQHLHQTLLTNGLNRPFSIIEKRNLLSQPKPDFRKQISGLKFCIRLILEPGSRPQLCYYFLLILIRPP